MAWLRWMCAGVVGALLGAGAVHALPPLGAPLPPFSARALDTLEEVRSEELIPDGSVTLLSFFTTWCTPCEKEIPDLLELTRRFGERGFRVVLVSLDQSEAEDIRRFLEQVGAGVLPAVWDEEGELMARYQVFSLPANLLIDRRGLVSMAWQGYLPEKLQELESRLAATEAPR